MLFAFKLILSPLLIGGATLAARRWGQSVGGWIVGLPLTSGPVSVFLALEQGREFASASAHGSLFGIAGVALFCAVYSRCAERLHWPWASLLTLAVYFSGVALFSLFHPSLAVAVCILFLALKLFLLILGLPGKQEFTKAAPWWDLPLRMTSATLLVLGITASASFLGPAWSGLLAPFPAFTFVMGVFAHVQYGPVAVRQVMRGVIVGCHAAGTFFLMVCLTVESLNLAAVYILATAAALAVNAGTFVLLKHIKM